MLANQLLYGLTVKPNETKKVLEYTNDWAKSTKSTIDKGVNWYKNLEDENLPEVPYVTPVYRLGTRSILNFAQSYGDALVEITDGLEQSLNEDLTEKQKLLQLGRASASLTQFTPAGVLGTGALSQAKGVATEIFGRSDKQVAEFMESVTAPIGNLVLNAEEEDKLRRLEKGIKFGERKAQLVGLNEKEQIAFDKAVTEYEILKSSQGAAADIMIDLLTFGAGKTLKGTGNLLKGAGTGKAKGKAINLYNEFRKTKKKADFSNPSPTDARYNLLANTKDDVSKTIKYVVEANNGTKSVKQTHKQIQKYINKYYDDIGKNIHSYELNEKTSLYEKKMEDGEIDYKTSDEILEGINSFIGYNSRKRRIERRYFDDNGLRKNLSEAEARKKGVGEEYRNELKTISENYETAVASKRASLKAELDSGRLTQKQHKALLDDWTKEQRALRDSEIQQTNEAYKSVPGREKIYSEMFSKDVIARQEAKVIADEVKSQVRSEFGVKKEYADAAKQAIKDHFAATADAAKSATASSINKFKKGKDKAKLNAYKQYKAELKQITSRVQKDKQKLKANKQLLTDRVTGYKVSKTLPIGTQNKLNQIKKRLGKKDLKKLDLQDIKRIENELIMEDFIGREKKNMVRIADKLENKRIAETIAGDLNTNEFVKNPYNKGVLNALNEFKESAKEWGAWILPMNNLINFISKSGAQGSGSTLYKFFKRPLDRAFGVIEQRNQSLNRKINKLTAGFSDVPLLEFRLFLHSWKMQGLDADIPLSNFKETNYAKANKDLITDRYLKDFELTPKELEIYEAVNSDYSKAYSEVNAFNKLYNNKELGFIENYASLYAENTDFRIDVDRLDADLGTHFANLHPSTKRSFLNQRKQIDISNLKTEFLGNYKRYMKEKDVLTVQVPVMKKLAKVVNRPEIRNKNTFAHKQLKEYLESQLQAPSNKYDKGIINYLRNSIYATYILGLKNIFYQPLAYLSSVGIVDPKDLIKFGKYSTVDFVKDFKEINKFIDKNMPEIVARSGGEVILYERQAKYKAEQYLADLISKSDQVAARPAAWAFYNLGLEKGMSKADAINYAQYEVGRTQGTAFMKDRPKATKSDIGKLIFLFRTMTLGLGGTFADLVKNNPKQAALFFVTLMAQEGGIDEVKELYNDLLGKKKYKKGDYNLAERTLINISPIPDPAAFQSGMAFTDISTQGLKSFERLMPGGKKARIKDVKNAFIAAPIPSQYKAGAGMAFDILDYVFD